MHADLLAAGLTVDSDSGDSIAGKGGKLLKYRLLGIWFTSTGQLPISIDVEFTQTDAGTLVTAEVADRQGVGIPVGQALDPNKYQAAGQEAIAEAFKGLTSESIGKGAGLEALKHLGDVNSGDEQEYATGSIPNAHTRPQIPAGVTLGWLAPKAAEARRAQNPRSPERLYFAGYKAPVAQRIEHLTTDQKVGSSNLFGRARENPHTVRVFCFLIRTSRLPECS